MPAARVGPERGDAIALIAGNGVFPRLFARAARDAGVAVRAIGLVGETNPALRGEVDELVWLRVGQLGGMRRQLRRWRAAWVAMAGGVDKRRLFRRARLDWTALKLLMSQALRRDDSLLRAVAGELERSGAQVVPSTLFLHEAMAPLGVLTGHAPDAKTWRDLRYGLQVARDIGRLDIGQSVAVRAGAVVALEAIEGTDAMIARAGALTGGDKVVVVKVAKPGQDMRFDVPAIGVRTIESLRAADITTLGIEASRTLLLEPQAVLASAMRHNITVVGL